MPAAMINDVREALLALHKSLIDMMREVHERRLGRRIAPGELLGLLTSDAGFDWLHPFSRLIISIDELLEREEPPSHHDAAALRLEVDLVIIAGAERYRDAVDIMPSVAFEHGRTTAALDQLPVAPPEEHERLRALRSTWNGPRRRRRHLAHPKDGE